MSASVVEAAAAAAVKVEQLYAHLASTKVADTAGKDLPLSERLCSKLWLKMVKSARIPGLQFKFMQSE